MRRQGGLGGRLGLALPLLVVLLAVSGCSGESTRELPRPYYPSSTHGSPPFDQVPPVARDGARPAFSGWVADPSLVVALGNRFAYVARQGDELRLEFVRGVDGGHDLPALVIGPDDGRELRLAATATADGRPAVLVEHGTRGEEVAGGSFEVLVADVDGRQVWRSSDSAQSFEHGWVVTSRAEGGFGQSGDFAVSDVGGRTVVDMRQTPGSVALPRLLEGVWNGVLLEVDGDTDELRAHDVADGGRLLWRVKPEPNPHGVGQRLPRVVGAGGGTVVVRLSTQPVAFGQRSADLMSAFVLVDLRSGAELARFEDGDALSEVHYDRRTDMIVLDGGGMALVAWPRTGGVSPRWNEGDGERVVAAVGGYLLTDMPDPPAGADGDVAYRSAANGEIVEADWLTTHNLRLVAATDDGYGWWMDYAARLPGADEESTGRQAYWVLPLDPPPSGPRT